MTAIRAHQERRTILDFSNGKYSKNRIKQALRTCNIESIKQGSGRDEYTFFTNEIKVGMYTIRLHLPFDSSKNWHKLRDYGDFEISIHESPSAPGVNLSRDSRFKSQYWSPKNYFGGLRIKHLIDIIAYCHRLDKLKAFL
jgi:hypothetical protein